MALTSSHEISTDIDIENSRGVEALRYWIIGHLDDHHSLRSLATRADMSISKLQKMFREAYGCSVFAFIRHERLHRAQRQLEVTAMNIKTISSEAGYSSVPAFTAAFSLAFGETPGRYRRGNK